MHNALAMPMTHKKSSISKQISKIRKNVQFVDFFLLFPPSKWFEWSREFPISQQEREEKLQKGLTFSTIFPFLDLPVCEILISVHQELKFFYHLWFGFGKNVHKYSTTDYHFQNRLRNHGSSFFPLIRYIIFTEMVVFWAICEIFLWLTSLITYAVVVRST